MIAANPTFSSEVLMQLMSDSPLPVYLNYKSLHVSFSLLGRISKRHRMWSTCLANRATVSEAEARALRDGFHAPDCHCSRDETWFGLGFGILQGLGGG